MFPEGDSGQSQKPTRLAVHPDYDPDTREADLAIVHLDQGLVFESGIVEAAAGIAEDEPANEEFVTVASSGASCRVVASIDGDGFLCVENLSDDSFGCRYIFLLAG